MKAIRFYPRIAPLLLLISAACGPAPPKAGEYKIALVPSRSGQHGIFVMNSDTSGGKLLTSDVTAQLRPNSWSRDGKRIAFLAVRKPDFEMLNRYRMPNHSTLYIMDANGGNQKRLLDFPVSDFGWSPNGKQLFFISAYENPERDEPAVQSGKKPLLASIYVLDVQTGRQTRLTGFGLSCSASWAPDGTRLAVSFASSVNSGIYEVSPDGQRGLHLSESTTTDVRPVWSPDGKMIAYVAAVKSGGDAKDTGVYTVNADGTSKRRVTDRAAYEVAWSPDGKLLLLQANGSVDLVDSHGQNRVHLSAPGDNPLDAAFTPDGRGVIFRSNQDGDWHLYFVDLKGQNRKRITGQLTASLFCLSPLLSFH